MKRKDQCTGEDVEFCTQHPETCSNPNCTQHN
jgi:hypothetical protein